MSEEDPKEAKIATKTSSLKNVTNINPRLQNMETPAEKKSALDKKSVPAKTYKRKAVQSDQTVVNKKKPLAVVQPQGSDIQLTGDREHCVENVVRKYEQLQGVISKKYVSVVERLKLDYVPLCCENLEYCHRKHYKKAPPPKEAGNNDMSLIRNALQQGRYDVFISLVWVLCHKEHFPGDVVLTNIVKLLLTLNPESNHNASLQDIIDQLLCLFDVILKTFPPCWLALRKSYIRFLRNTMEMSSLLPDKQLNAKNTIFEIVLMLLEDNLDDITRSAKKRKASANTSASTSSLAALTHYDNEFHNMQHWEKNEKNEQTFSALSRSTRIERLMQVLHFLAKILEMDMAMWMLRYYKNPAKYLYNSSDQPLVIELFSLSAYMRSTVVVKKVMSLFSLCVEKNLNPMYLNIMGRFISLLANVQNLCEVENTPSGIKYPIAGPGTSAFTNDFYKTTEVNMKTSVGTYIKFVRHLKCPFVRFEYIDIFLKRLNPAAGKMNPQKVFENFRKNRWLQCEPDDERPLDDSKQKSVVYRQDYLEFILLALQSYCDFFALKEFFQEIVQSAEEEKSVADKPQKPKSNAKKEIDLSKMCKSITKLEKTVHKSVAIRVDKEEIQTLDIAVNADLMKQYRNDLKYLYNLYSYICALQSEHEQDFSQMIEFLKHFAPSR